MREVAEDTSCAFQRKEVFKGQGGGMGPAAAQGPGVRQDRVRGGTGSRGERGACHETLSLRVYLLWHLQGVSRSACTLLQGHG